MKCVLCHKNKKLLKKSHVIPDFMYKELFDEKHRLYEALLSPDYQLKSKTRQTGGYDKNILCGNCDNKIFGRLERYASLVLFGGIELSIKAISGESKSTYVHVKGIDYRKFKLFLLSMLWRASISKLPIFRNVDLDEHQQVIREKIIKNNPGSSHEYPCAIFTYLHNRKLPHQVIAEPGCIINDKQRIYAFLISGILFVFFTSTDENTEWARQCTINEKGEMKLIQMSDSLSSKTINKFVGIDLF